MKNASKSSGITERSPACLSVHDAVRASDVTALMSSVRDGATGVNDVDQEHRFTPLHWAAQTGSLECLHWLLWNGADASCKTPQGWTAAHLAAIKGQRACMEALIVNGVDLSVPDQRGCTPAHLAAAHCHSDTLQTILRTGADPDSVAGNGWTPVHYAAFHGRVGCLQVLTKWGGSVDTTDQNGNTPAHLAAGEGHVFCFKFLVLKGGGLVRTLQARNNHGESPHDLALRFHKHPVLHCIHALHQQPDISQEQDALAFPAHAVAFQGDLATLRKLVECGVANINERDEDGATPMHKTAGQGHLTCLQWLLEMGADHTIRNNAGETPRDTAKRFAQLAAVKMLGEAGSGGEEEEEGERKMRSYPHPSEGVPWTAAQRKEGRERANQRLLELRRQVEIAQSNYKQLGGELQDTDPVGEAESALQELQAELERERERRERLETQLDEHRAQIRRLQQTLQSIHVTTEEKRLEATTPPEAPTAEKKKLKKKKMREVGGVFVRKVTEM